MGLRVVPVLDVKGGLAVRAFRGLREAYRPLTAWYCQSPRPVDLAESLRRTYGFSELYVADLDSIEGAAPSVEVYDEVRRRGLKVMVDAGVRALDDALRLEGHVDVVVVGTETLESFDELRRIVEALGPERVVASIDVKEGRLLARSLGVGDPLEAAAMARRAGVEGALLVVLDDVGTLKGPNVELAARIASHAGLRVLVGGGVRGVEDLLRLREAGVEGALVGTAIHLGLIRPRDLELLHQPPSPP